MARTGRWMHDEGEMVAAERRQRSGDSEMVAGCKQGSHVSLKGCNFRWRLVENFDIL